MKLKFCGIRRLEDVQLMNEFLPDYIGYIFAPSKRRISPETATELSSKLDSRIKRVGVFVNETLENILFTAQNAKLDAVQLHGDEKESDIKSLRIALPRLEIWKAVRVRIPQDILEAQKYSCDRLLLDSFSIEASGGTGKVADLTSIKESGIKEGFFLAGGLNAENFNIILKQISLYTEPYGLDISSGIEKDGFKNREKIMEIMRCIECLR